MNYRHIYHAGNFADVVKHITLSQLITHLTQKDKPLLYLETHAGKGLYDLHHKQALKTGEATQGIDLLWSQRQHLPTVFASYLQTILDLNDGPNLRYYPGSPYIAIKNLRKQDRLSLSELHPAEFAQLEKLPHPGKRVFFNHNDGLTQLKSLLPPIERRGLIFLDPSYEIKTEYRTVPMALKEAYHRFATGVYCLWYPLVDKKLHSQLMTGLNHIGSSNNLRIEFYLTGITKPGMTGCGLWIINPPYLLAKEIKEALDSLRKLFNPGVSSYLIEQ
mgnify:CR=1 FL=1